MQGVFIQRFQRVRHTFDRLSQILRPETEIGDDGGMDSLADERPLRAELFSVNQLEQHAKSMAGWHEVGSVKAGRGADKLLPRLRANERVLRDAYEVVTDAVKKGRRITPAAEWFLDNYHLIEEQIRTARRHLPRGYSRELPRLTNGDSAGLPRVYGIALELISHADGRVDADSLRAFVIAYQSVQPLLLGELWAIPIMLRLALLENLRRVAFHVMTARRERERAENWVEQMLEVSSKTPANVVLVLADMVRENPPLTNAFVSEFASRLQGQGPAMVFAVTWMEQRLAEQGQTIEHVYQQASQGQAGHQVSIGNSIGSLRFLGAADWRDFVEAMSVVEHALLADPAGVYPAMDFATRDEYRHAIEQIAKRGRLSEEEVARKTIELAANRELTTQVDSKGIARVDPPALAGRRAHVGYYLIDRGRRSLERAAEVRLTPSMLLRRFAEHFSLASYLYPVALVTIAVVSLVLWWTYNSLGVLPAGLTLLGVPLAIAGSQLAVALLNWVSTKFIKPSVLPRMDFVKGIPADHRTIVAVPTMLTSEQDVDDLLEALEVRYLANRDENLSFSLLTDYRDAASETTSADDGLLKRAKDGINRLNARYLSTTTIELDEPPGRSNIDGDFLTLSDDLPPMTTVGVAACRGCFYLFHRARRWNAEEGVWMGWERKRGKLEQFNAALRGDRSAFHTIIGPCGDADLPAGVKYVITLDSDTQLPRDSARELAGMLAHPLNRPYFDPKLGRVTDGYSILQPRVGINIPSAGRSRYALLFAGDAGIDPYTRAVSDVYQDLFR